MSIVDEICEYRKELLKHFNVKRGNKYNSVCFQLKDSKYCDSFVKKVSELPIIQKLEREYRIRIKVSADSRKSRAYIEVTPNQIVFVCRAELTLNEFLRMSESATGVKFFIRKYGIKDTDNHRFGSDSLSVILFLCDYFRRYKNSMWIEY